jgi:hypothetical protein
VLWNIRNRPERKIDNLKEIDNKILKRDANLAETKQIYASSDSLQLPSILNEHFDVISPDEILFDGELMKYNPGFKY